MPESRYKYLYERLGDHDFQQLVGALLTHRYPDFVPLALRQADGGRDGVREREALIYQVKWLAEGRHKDPVAWLDASVHGEERNLRRLAASGVRRYVLVTNVPSTAKAETGTFDRLGAKLVAYAREFGFETMTCYWREAVDGMVDGAPDEIRRQYLAMLAGEEAARYATCAHVDWPTPRQLPPAPPGFVGRQPELLAITEAASLAGGGATVISVLTGPGGVGKTSTALRWAHLHADRYPDGQLYVDLHGFSPSGEPIAATTALHGLLHGLGVHPDRVPDHVDARAALYRSLVAGKQVLVVLDNAVTVDQVVPLLPGNTAGLVLVTSRHRLTGLTVAHDVHPVHVDVLPESDARALLHTGLGAGRAVAEPAAVDAVVAACDGLPLALAVVAGHARTHPELSLSALACDLRDAAGRLDALDTGDPATSLRTVLSWSTDVLTPQQREVFALLGPAPGPDISLPAAARLVGMAEPRTRGLLASLADASLLHHDGRGRYRMHDLARAHAVDLVERDLAPRVREDAQRRLLDFYVDTAHHADRLLHPQRRPAELAPPARLPSALRNTADALSWFTAEHPHLLAAQRTASTLGWHLTTWRLAWAMATYHQRRGHRDDRVAVWTAALDAAAHLGNPAATVRAHRHLGHACADLNRLGAAFEHLTDAVDLALEHRDTVQQAHTHRTLAWAWERACDYRRALAHAEQALFLYRELGRQADEATALNYVGWLNMWCRDDAAARAHCEAALALHRRLRNPDGEAHTLDSLGWIAQNCELHTIAVDHYTQALRIHRALGNTYSVANTLDRLGIPHEALREYDAARDAWREAHEIYSQQGRRDVVRVRSRLAHLDRITDR